MTNTFLFSLFCFILSLNIADNVKLTHVQFNEKCQSINLFNDLKSLSVGDSIEINAQLIENAGYLYIHKINTNEIAYGNSIDPSNVRHNALTDSIVYDYKNMEHYSASSAFEPYALVLDKRNNEMRFYVYDSVFVEYCKVKWK